MNPDEMPIFQKYDISELARKTGYSEVYLLEMKKGYRPIRQRFRHVATTVLGVTEDELFALAHTTGSKEEGHGSRE